MAATSTAIPSRVDRATACRAVDALLKWLQAQAKQQKPQLLEQEGLVYLVMSLKKIPTHVIHKPQKIPLPHPPLASPSLQICLIVDDRRNSPVTSDAAKKKINAESLPVAKVLKLSKLKSDFRPFEARRRLCGSYDLFFADRRIVPLLPKLLGKVFIKKKRLPIPLDLYHKNWKDQILYALSSAFLHLRTGTCSILKVAWTSQSRDEIVDNVLAAIDGAVAVIPKKWDNIRSFHVRALNSVALPLYQALPSMGLRIEAAKEEEKYREVVSAEEKGEKLNTAEKKKKSNKNVAKMGRIHEVRYLDDDGNVEELMEDMVKGNEADEIGSDREFSVIGEDNELDNAAVMKKKKKKKVVTTKKVELPLQKKSANVDDDSVDDGKKVMLQKKRKKKDPAPAVYDVSKLDEEKENAVAKKEKVENPKKKGSVKNDSHSLDADEMDNTNKKKKRLKAGEGEGKDKKMLKKESKKRHKP